MDGVRARVPTDSAETVAGPGQLFLTYTTSALDVGTSAARVERKTTKPSLNRLSPRPNPEEPLAPRCQVRDRDSDSDGDEATAVTHGDGSRDWGDKPVGGARRWPGGAQLVGGRGGWEDCEGCKALVDLQS